jgi:phosphatidylglycerol:prolipoprotein diacylglycerol transferase
MLWNFLAFALIIYITRRFAAQMKPGAAFFGWLIMAGVGRFIIEFFRPDQPRLGGTWVSTTQVVAFLMALAGLLMLAYRYGKLKLPLPPFPETYTVAPASLPAGGQKPKKH